MKYGRNMIKCTKDNDGNKKQKDKKPRIESIDSIRGVAACIVAFVWHYQHFQPISKYPFASIFVFSYEYGWLMVELFFIVSGFMMSYQYKDNILGRRISFFEYCKKKFYHLWPLMFVTLLVVTAQEFMYQMINGETFVYGSFDLYHFILNILLIQNGWIDNTYSFNGPAWCISIELLCYLVFWFVIKKTKEETLLVKYLLLIIVGIGVCQKGLDLPLLNISTARGLIGFFVGSILYEIYMGCKVKRNFFNALLGIVLCVTYIITRLCGYTWIGNVHFFFALFCAPMIIWLAVDWKPLRWLLECKPLVFLGKCSVHIYLWHFPVQCMFKIVETYNEWSINYSSKKIFLLYILLSLMVSVVSFYITNYIKRHK